jgi:hypothetical protein
MDHLFDEFSRSPAESVPRRESLRRLGAVLAGAALSPLGLGAAPARKPDPCANVCKCRNGAQQSQCLTACKACKGDVGRIGGACGSYVCCATASCRGTCSNLKSNPNCGACGNDCRAYGQACCGGYCADLASDVFNCGRCDVACAAPRPYETVACVSGRCVYGCVPGAVVCNGACTNVDVDPHNCGGCGNACGGSTPYCDNGSCTDLYCGGADLYWDSNNCGECGNRCPPQFACAWGVCEGICIGCGF